MNSNSKRQQVDPNQVKSILVRSPNWIGDQVMALPFFYKLRKTFKNAKITSLCVPWVKDIQYTDLVDEILVLDRPNPEISILDKVTYFRDQTLKIRAAGPFEISITLSDSFSSALLLQMAKIPVRVGYQSDFRSWMLTHKQKPSREIGPRALAYLQLLQSVVPAYIPNREDVSAALSNTAIEKSWGIDPARDPYRSLKASVNNRYYVIAPGATADSRRWPVDSWIDLCRRIYEKYQIPGIVVGGAKEAPLAQRLAREEGLKLYDGTAKSKVSELYTLFKDSQFAMTNESGLSHVSALSAPFTHVVCGAANPERTRPIGPKPVFVSFNAVSCWPCEKNDCRMKTQKLACLLGIHPDGVFAEISARYDRILAGFSLDKSDETA